MNENDKQVLFMITEKESIENKIKCINICNDNHAGSFGYIVNSAFKTYIELKYTERIEIINNKIKQLFIR